MTQVKGNGRPATTGYNNEARGYGRPETGYGLASRLQGMQGISSEGYGGLQAYSEGELVNTVRSNSEGTLVGTGFLSSKFGDEPSVTAGSAFQSPRFLPTGVPTGLFDSSSGIGMRIGMMSGLESGFSMNTRIFGGRKSPVFPPGVNPSAGGGFEALSGIPQPPINGQPSSLDGVEEPRLASTLNQSNHQPSDVQPGPLPIE